MRKQPQQLPDGTLVLGIESSCDDSAAVLYQVGRGVIAHRAAGQAHLHTQYAGVVPELAARDHATQLLPLVTQVLGSRRPAAVACTTGPGLAGCLVAGAGLAQALAYGWGVPLAQVNHLEGHLLSPFLDPQPGFTYPYLCLLVSGGHTALYIVRGTSDYDQLGTTVDDAAGEAFDKTGILLGLDFPGGPQLEQLAKCGRTPSLIKAAMQRQQNYNFSFSGLKTAARRLRATHSPADIAASFQQAAVTTLVTKIELALKNYPQFTRLAVVGGVGRNQVLRRALQQVAAQYQVRLFHPPLQWCTDNAAMIAYAGLHRLQHNYAIQVKPRWPLS